MNPASLPGSGGAATGRRRAGVVVALLLVLVSAGWFWRSELFIVASPGDAPRPMVSLPAAGRVQAELDVVLPVVPVGMRRLQAGAGPLLIHFWAPWERHARDQIRALDSLRREPDLEGLQVVVVCADPFPSVARFVARQKLRLPVLLDGPGEMRRQLPCPSVPYTYGIDADGRIAIRHPGEVDWWAAETRRSLAALARSPAGSGRAIPPS